MSVTGSMYDTIVLYGTNRHVSDLLTESSGGISTLASESKREIVPLKQYYMSQ